MTIPLLQGLLNVQGIQIETVQARKLRMARTLRQANECWGCGKHPPEVHLNEHRGWDGYEEITRLFCDGCQQKNWHSLDGIWR